MMNKIYLDANILIYYLSKKSSHHDVAEELIKHLVSSSSVGIVNDYVINEAHYILSRKRETHKVNLAIREFMNLDSVIYESKFFTPLDIEKCFEICELYNFKITDAYHAYFCKKNKIKKIATFDAHFKRIPWLSVVTI